MERYLCIVRPFCVRRIRMWMKLVACAIIWIYSLAVSTPPLFGWSRYELDGYRISCCFDYTSRTPNVRSYIVYLFTFAFVFPFSVIIFCYFRLFALVRNGPMSQLASNLNPLIETNNNMRPHRNSEPSRASPLNRSMMKLSVASTTASPLADFRKRTNESGNLRITNAFANRRREFRLAQTTFFVTFFFVASWSPYCKTLKIVKPYLGPWTLG